MDLNRLRKLSGMQIVKEEKDIDAALVKFFKEHRNASAKKLDALAQELNVSKEQLENRVDVLITSLLKKIGRHGDVPDDKFDQEQLKMGIAVEKEHTGDDFIAELIAKDHLSELPNYYTLLDQMEKTGKEELKSVPSGPIEQKPVEQDGKKEEE